MTEDASHASASRGRRSAQPEQEQSGSSWFSRDHLDDLEAGEAQSSPHAPADDDVAAREIDPSGSPWGSVSGQPQRGEPGHAKPSHAEPGHAESGRTQTPHDGPPWGGPSTGGSRALAGNAETTGEEVPAQSRRTTEQRYADAIAAMNRIVGTQDFSALPWVTEVFRVTAGVLDESDPARASVLNNLGTAAQLTFATSSDLADLEDALGYYRSAVNSAADNDQDLVLYRCNLVLAATDYATQTRGAESSREAVELARETVRGTPQQDQRRHMALVRLANALRLRARLASDVHADEESIDAFRAAARTAPEGESAELLVNLGAALTRQHERNGDTDSLNESVHYLSTGAGMLADGTPRHRALCYLASALRLRFHANGDLADLNSAIGELLGVLTAAPDGNPLKGRSARYLAECAIDYVDATGEPQPLRRVLRPIADAVRMMRGTDSYTGPVLALYGALLRRHYQHRSDDAALDTAVAVGEDAVRHASHAQRASILVSLVNTLLTRYEHTRKQADLERAEQLAAQLTGERPDNPAEALHTALVGKLALYRFRDSGQAGDLNEAVERLSQALNGIPESMPARADTAIQLSRALRALQQRSGRRRNYRWARKVLTEAADQVTAPADQRLRAAESAGRLAARAQRWSDATASFTQAVELLPLVPRAKRVVAAPGMQQRWALITADAAACAVEAGEPETAVKLLEHGNTALLTDFLPTGGELGELHRTHPQLADEAVRLRRLLDRPTAEAVLDPVDDRARLAQSWDALLGQLRSADENHLRPAGFPELAAAGNTSAEHGAVVLLNLSRYRSDALVVFGGRVLTVPLPKATPEAAAEQAGAALAGALRRDEPLLRGCLEWSWQHIVRPVLARMGYTRTPPPGKRWPRVWWCVTGPATYLPLHAATASDGTSALERIVSSYTPTLRTLLRGRYRDRPRSPNALVAAGSTEHVARELPRRNQVVARHWPHADVVSTETASSTDVLHQLPEYSWVHVCERSVAYPGQPAAGNVLARENAQGLGVVEIGQVPLQHAELCTLGRCATAPETPSPAAVTLPAALGFAGYVHVLGSLWETDERSVGDALEGVYAEIVGGEIDHTGYALHDAARRLREEFPTDPSRWAGFVHVGP